MDMVVRISHKWSSVVQISHNVCIPVHFCTEILVRDREHAFWKMLTKENSHKGMCCVKISHKGNGWCEFCCVLAFLPCFPLFLASPVLIIKKHKLNQTKIKLKQEIKIKTNLKIK